MTPRDRRSQSARCTCWLSDALQPQEAAEQQQPSAATKAGSQRREEQLQSGFHTPPQGEHAAEKGGGRGETHGPGLVLLHDQPPRTRRGAGRGRGGDGAGRVLHLPEREGEAEEGRVR